MKSKFKLIILAAAFSLLYSSSFAMGPSIPCNSSNLGMLAAVNSYCVGQYKHTPVFRCSYNLESGYLWLPALILVDYDPQNCP